MCTRNTQILRANDHSKNGVTIAVDTDTALLNVDKNNKILRKTTKHREPNKSFYQNMRKDRKFTKQKHSQ